MIAIFDIDSLIYEACYNADEFQEAADKFFNKYNDAIYNLNGDRWGYPSWLLHKQLPQEGRLGIQSQSNF
jgi:hypothetical protein